MLHFRRVSLAFTLKVIIAGKMAAALFCDETCYLEKKWSSKNAKLELKTMSLGPTDQVVAGDRPAVLISSGDKSSR